ncbi:hypothetical protein [Caulobacter sp. NIBR2454]|uniref:hypothetical protein n=1 Tax=Caulobacter sp. NIBR2454 TaxID=3015996 RepID=UPI0022B66BB1|nr:hypothetical protein [Caulobacter sp. NIBR2454]
MPLNALFPDRNQTSAPASSSAPTSQPKGLKDRLTNELNGLVERAPASVRPAASNVVGALSRSPVLLALAIGAGLVLVTNKRTRGGMAALLGVAAATAGRGRAGR